MQRLYLIRHARPSAGWGGSDDDPGLDETGHAQARAASERLLALPPHERPRRVVSSPLRRCRETAAPFAQALGVEVEIDPAVGEIPTPAGLAHADRPAWLARAMGGRWDAVEGDLDYGRWRTAIVEALRGYAGAAVFSHFVAINGAISTLEGDERVVVFRPDHASITILDVAPDGLVLVERGQEAVTRVA
ncbi:MAG TPA: histidine phosphatase family protein [Caulobacteraceae bacterium]|jgi:broad specificity phosphatase PhoE|nr:histidine phosphatase family protein [Caulobacteraceae bacterium]